MRIAVKAIRPRDEFDKMVVTVELLAKVEGNLVNGGDVDVFVDASDSLEIIRQRAIDAIRAIAEQILAAPAVEYNETVEPDIDNASHADRALKNLEAALKAETATG